MKFDFVLQSILHMITVHMITVQMLFVVLPVQRTCVGTILNMSIFTHQFITVHTPLLNVVCGDICYDLHCILTL
jgi:hypothetical protein